MQAHTTRPLCPLRRRRLAPLLALLSLGSALASCAATGSAANDANEPAHRYVFVFLKTGPATDLDTEALQAAFEGHFSNMARMAEAGQLLMAGPMGEPKSDAAHRGLWLFDTEHVAQALEWGATDPTVQLGVFVLEAHTFETESDLTRLRELDRLEEERRLADPDIPDEWQGRGYVLASRPAGATEDLTRLAARGGIAIAGLLRASELSEPSEPRGADRLLVWLTESDPSAARRLLPDSEAWTLHGWYGSAMVAELGKQVSPAITN